MVFNSERFNITCCKDCTDRHPGCHGKCEKYIQQRADYDAQKAEARKKYDIACGLYEQRSDSIYKLTERKRYQNRYK